LNRLADIAVRVESVAPPGGLGGGVTAILAELATMLERVAETQVAMQIDLRSLPMSPQDRAELLRVLGNGEVSATIEADGPSTLRETQVAGLWWVEHRNRDGELLAELLEVSRVPEILASTLAEMAASGRELRQRIAAHAATPASGPAAPQH
jgi:hydrogenase-1 operon protein HyaF